MSKAFAWGKQPTEKQKEVMTPSAPLSTGKEPKIHHGSSTWFSPSTAIWLDNSSQPKSFSEAVRETKTNKETNNDLDLVKSMNNKEKEMKVQPKDINKVKESLGQELPMEEIKQKDNKEWMHTKDKNSINKDNALYKEEERNCTRKLQELNKETMVEIDTTSRTLCFKH